MRYNRIISVLLAAMLLLTVLPAAAEDALTDCFDAQRDLLFSTGNVTLRAEAVFSLDGTEFKDAILEHRQSGDRSVRELVMLTPKKDGTVRRSGYTVVTDGDEACGINSDPDAEYRFYYVYPLKSTILRKRTGMNNLISLARINVSRLPVTAEITEHDDRSRTVHAELDKANVPDDLNAVIGLIFHHAISCYAGLDFFSVTSTPVSAIHDYVTVADGIMYCTDTLELQSLTADITLDSAGRLAKCTGTAQFLLKEKDGMYHEAAVTWTEEAFDYGRTVLTSSDPEHYDTWH